jgi:hypothetical protein
VNQQETKFELQPYRLPSAQHCGPTAWLVRARHALHSPQLKPGQVAGPIDAAPLRGAGLYLPMPTVLLRETHAARLVRTSSKDESDVGDRVKRFSDIV